MVKSFIIVLFCSLFIINSTCFAQGKVVDLSEELLQIEVNMAESRYNLVKNDENKYALIAAYEKMIGQTCMPNLHTDMRYKGQPTNKECLKYLQLVEEFTTQDQVAVCARNGIDSEVCKTRALDQVFEVFDPDSKTDIPDLDAKLASVGDSRQGEINKKAIDDAMSKLKIKPSVENFDELIKSWRNYVLDGCKVIRVSFRPTEVKEPEAGALGIKTVQKQEERGKKGKKNEVVEEKIEETPADLVLTRIVSVSDDCKSKIEEALKFNPHFPEAICVRSGPYSPDCVNAYRQWKKMMDMERKALASIAQSTRDSGNKNRNAAGFKEF